MDKDFNMDREDIIRCIEVVRKILIEKEINVSEDVLEKMTKDIMSISYSTGGDYSSKIIQRYAETYIERKLYEEFL
ncbi:MAG: hypothetical protein OSJ60_21560 [Lachnospiraceae bacterium]|jgi:hypothetical protein|nr:hypothetical protein [Lachnospiraceae bacterium]